MFTDPTLWLAVAIWCVLLLPALGLFRAAALGDRQMEQARADVEERREFRTWDASGDLPYATRAMDADGLGGL